MKRISGDVPKGRSKPKFNPIDSDPYYVNLIQKLASGTMKPLQYEGLEFSHDEMVKKLDVKFPWRVVRDRLNRYLRESRLNRDFRVIAKEISPGIWAVGAVYEPVEVETKAKRGATRERKFGS